MTPWSVMTARFSLSRAMLAMAKQTAARTCWSRDSSRLQMSSRPPTKLRTMSPEFSALRIHGDSDQAAAAWRRNYDNIYNRYLFLIKRSRETDLLIESFTIIRKKIIFTSVSLS